MLRCASCQLRIVGHEQNGGAELVDLLEQVHHLACHERVEVAGRLVGEQERRVAGDGARDRDALLLAAGELRGHVLHARGEAHQLERAVDALAPVGAAQPPVAQGHVHVVLDIQVRDQVEALEDETDAFVAQARTRVIGEVADIAAIEHVAAGLKALQQAGDIEEGGLAGARRPGHGDELPRADLEGEVAQRVGLNEVGAVDLADILHLEHC